MLMHAEDHRGLAAPLLTGTTVVWITVVWITVVFRITWFVWNLPLRHLLMSTLGQALHHLGHQPFITSAIKINAAIKIWPINLAIKIWLVLGIKVGR